MDNWSAIVTLFVFSPIENREKEGSVLHTQIEIMSSDTVQLGENGILSTNLTIHLTVSVYTVYSYA